jgi:hypothetical protein
VKESLLDVDGASFDKLRMRIVVPARTIVMPSTTPLILSFVEGRTAFVQGGLRRLREWAMMRSALARRKQCVCIAPMREKRAIVSLQTKRGRPKAAPRL